MGSGALRSPIPGVAEDPPSAVQGGLHTLDLHMRLSLGRGFRVVPQFGPAILKSCRLFTDGARGRWVRSSRTVKAAWAWPGALAAPSVGLSRTSNPFS